MADTGDESSAAAPAGRGPMLAALFCAVWQLGIGFAAAWVVVDQVFGDRLVAGALAGTATAAAGGADMLRSLVVCVAGSLIGGVMNGLFYLQYYAAERGQFSYRFVGSYMLAPLAIGMIGLTAFALVTGGIIVFAAAPVAAPAGAPAGAGVAALADVNLLAYLALGIIAGIAWKTIMARVQDAADNIFGKNRRAVSRGETGERDAPGPAARAETDAERPGALVAFEKKEKG